LQGKPGNGDRDHHPLLHEKLSTCGWSEAREADHSINPQSEQ
jgi:hypothetical protein